MLKTMIDATSGRKFEGQVTDEHFCISRKEEVLSTKSLPKGEVSYVFPNLLEEPVKLLKPGHLEENLSWEIEKPAGNGENPPFDAVMLVKQGELDLVQKIQKRAVVMRAECLGMYQRSLHKTAALKSLVVNTRNTVLPQLDKLVFESESEYTEFAKRSEHLTKSAQEIHSSLKARNSCLIKARNSYLIKARDSYLIKARKIGSWMSNPNLFEVLVEVVGEGESAEVKCKEGLTVAESKLRHYLAWGKERLKQWNVKAEKARSVVFGQGIGEDLSSLTKACVEERGERSLFGASLSNIDKDVLKLESIETDHSNFIQNLKEIGGGDRLGVRNLLNEMEEKDVMKRLKEIYSEVETDMSECWKLAEKTNDTVFRSVKTILEIRSTVMTLVEKYSPMFAKHSRTASETLDKLLFAQSLSVVAHNCIADLLKRWDFKKLVLESKVFKRLKKKYEEWRKRENTRRNHSKLHQETLLGPFRKVQGLIPARIPEQLVPGMYQTDWRCGRVLPSLEDLIDKGLPDRTLLLEIDGVIKAEIRAKKKALEEEEKILEEFEMLENKSPNRKETRPLDDEEMEKLMKCEDFIHDLSDESAFVVEPPELKEAKKKLKEMAAELESMKKKNAEMGRKINSLEKSSVEERSVLEGRLSDEQKKNSALEEEKDLLERKLAQSRESAVALAAELEASEGEVY